MSWRIDYSDLGLGIGEPRGNTAEPEHFSVTRLFFTPIPDRRRRGKSEPRVDLVRYWNEMQYAR